jgi:hypothetical protein
VRIEVAFPHRIAIVLLGSLARGEGTALVREGRTFVLSDLDLAVLFRTAAERERAARELPGVTREFARAMRSWGLLGPVDAGAFSLAQLPVLSARPGTREFKRSGKVISGDRAALAGAAEIAAERIPREEALALCENRLLELLWAHPALERGRPAPLAAAYAGGKAVLDGTLARLVCAGSCPDGVRERLAAAETLLGSAAPGSAAAERLEALRFWTQFKLEPEETALAKRYGGESAHAADGGRADAAACARAWREGARHLLALYRETLEESGGGGGAAGGGAAGFADAAAWRRAARRAPLRRRARRWLELWRKRRALGHRRGGADWLFVRALRGTPEHLLGATAAALTACAPGMDAGEAERRVAEQFARAATPVAWPRDAAWGARRSQLVKGWDRWVLRGTRTGPGDAPWDDH